MKKRAHLGAFSRVRWCRGLEKAPNTKNVPKWRKRRVWLGRQIGWGSSFGCPGGWVSVNKKILKIKKLRCTLYARPLSPCPFRVTLCHGWLCRVLACFGALWKEVVVVVEL